LEASRLFASRAIRNRATIGGNLCNASPCTDAAPPLLALDASVGLQDASGRREIPLAAFFVGPGRTALRHGEILREIHIPCRDGRFGYMKLGRRQGFNLSIVSLAAFGVITNGRIEDIRVALGAVAPTPIRSTTAEEELKGCPLRDAAIERAARCVRQDVKTEADIREAAFDTRGSPTYRRASSAYRVEITHIMARRVLTELCYGKGAPR
jgi:CO/xanthine dehydrogenase FAD-binding subunit